MLAVVFQNDGDILSYDILGISINYKNPFVLFPFPIFFSQNANITDLVNTLKHVIKTLLNI